MVLVIFSYGKYLERMTYNIMINGGSVEEHFNYKTDNYMFSPIFIANSYFKGWSMDNTFNKTFKRKLKDNLIAGKKYKTYLNSLSGFMKKIKNEFVK